MVAATSMRAIEGFTGFRRRFRITPAAGSVLAEVEDDFHCMAVRVEHDGSRATRVVPELRRAPWTTCPGAGESLRSTFEGRALADFARAGQKKLNCTHLYDLAMLAAAHAFDARPIEYDIYVSDAHDGQRAARIFVGGREKLHWTEAGFRILEPAEIAGTGLFEMNDWMEGLDPELREAAKLLRWANVLANGRAIPLEQQSDASKMPPNCYTFQPQRAAEARRVGRIRDFSLGRAEPLDGA